MPVSAKSGPEKGRKSATRKTSASLGLAKPDFDKKTRPREEEKDGSRGEGSQGQDRAEEGTVRK